jgi:peptidoglycan/LPS O-acetylase OafA/YrhL
MGLIRIILAIAVVFAHLPLLSNKALVPGNIAVELFFIISGYYMAMVADSGTYFKGLKMNAISFYKSRFFRLYPTFIIISAASILYYYVLWVLLGKEPTNDTDSIYAVSNNWLKISAFISNLSMIGQDLFGLFHVLPNGEIKMFYARNTGMTADGAIWLGNLRVIGQAWSIGT